MSKQKITGKRTVSGSALKVLYIEELKTDPSYQRDVVPGHKKIVADFMPEALGIPLVGEREDGTKWIVDGLQRITALRKLGKKSVRAEVFASSGPEHEAEVFRRVNKNRTALKPLELYHAMLTAGDEKAWAVKNLVEEYDFTIPKRGDTGPSKQAAEKLADMMRCINSVLHVYRRGGEQGLRFVLSIIKECWPNDPQRTRDVVVMGLYEFWHRRKGSVDAERLVPRLNTTTPSKMMYSAQLGVGNRFSVVADVIEKLYKMRSLPKRK